MAAALGMILGAGLGIGKQKLQQEREHKEKLADMIMQQAASGQFDLSKSPEGSKIVEGVYGKEATGAATSIFSQMNAPLQGAPQVPGAGGAGGQPPSSQGQGGASPTNIHPGGLGDPGDPKTWQEYSRKIQEMADANPSNQRVQEFAKNHIEFATKQLEELQKQQDFEQTRADRQQTHADTEADREATRQMTAQTHADNLALHQETLGLQAQNAAFMHQIQFDKEDDARKAHFQSATQNLASQTANIAKMLTAATPAEPATVKTLLNARNASARTLKQAADKAGIDYDAEQFKPLTVQQVSKGGIAGYFGGKTTSLTDTPDSSAAGGGANIRTDTTGKKWKLNAKGDGWEPAS